MNKSLDDIAREFGGGDWTAGIRGLPRSATLWHEHALKRLCGHVGANLEKCRRGRVYNWSLLGIHLSEGEVLQQRKFVELFEPSLKSLPVQDLTRQVLERLQDGCASLGLEGSARTLASWKSFVDLSMALDPVRRRLADRIRADPQTIHAALARLEDAFTRDQNPSPKDSQLGSEQILPNEELAEAVSYLIARSVSRGALPPGALAVFRTSDIITEKRAGIINDAYRLRQIHEAEAAVFRFGYRCTRSEDRAFIIEPPSDAMGMALSLGYLKTQLSSTPSDEQMAQLPATAFRELCEEGAKRIGSALIRVETEPFSRLVVAVPEAILREMGDQLFLSNSFYQEDLWELDRLRYEMGIEIVDIEEFEVASDLTLMDVLKISRLFRFLFLFRRPALEALREQDPVAYWNSMVSSTTRSEHIRFLGAAGVDASKAESFLDLFSWSVQGTRRLDLQYTPIIDLGNVTRPLLAVFSCSNGIRNGLMTTKKRVLHDGARDPVTTRLLQVLSERTKHAWRNVEYRSDVGGGEIDVLAVLGSSLFVFECKATMLPCSEFEQRTLFDYVSRAADQLDRFRKAYTNPAFRESLSEQLQLSLPPTLTSTIVLSTRLLSGTTIRGHAVRHIHELANIISVGEGILQLGSSKYDLDLWRCRQFDQDVLVEYLDSTSALYRATWAAFTRTDEVLDIGGVSVRRARYGLSGPKLVESMKQAGFTLSTRTAEDAPLGNQGTADT